MDVAKSDFDATIGDAPDFGKERHICGSRLIREHIESEYSFADLFIPSLLFLNWSDNREAMNARRC